MTIEEIKQHNARIIERNRPFEAILTNPDFIEWQKVGPLAELEDIKSKIVTIDRTSSTWKEDIADYVVSYQAIARVMLITIQKADESRKGKASLKELDTV